MVPNSARLTFKAPLNLRDAVIEDMICPINLFKLAYVGFSIPGGALTLQTDGDVPLEIQNHDPTRDYQHRKKHTPPETEIENNSLPEAKSKRTTKTW